MFIFTSYNLALDHLFFNENGKVLALARFEENYEPEGLCSFGKASD